MDRYRILIYCGFIGLFLIIVEGFALSYNKIGFFDISPIGIFLIGFGSLVCILIGITKTFT